MLQSVELYDGGPLAGPDVGQTSALFLQAKSPLQTFSTDLQPERSALARLHKSLQVRDLTLDILQGRPGLPRGLVRLCEPSGRHTALAMGLSPRRQGRDMSLEVPDPVFGRRTLRLTRVLRGQTLRRRLLGIPRLQQRRLRLPPFAHSLLQARARLGVGSGDRTHLLRAQESG